MADSSSRSASSKVACCCGGVSVIPSTCDEFMVSLACSFSIFLSGSWPGQNRVPKGFGSKLLKRTIFIEQSSCRDRALNI